MVAHTNGDFELLLGMDRNLHIYHCLADTGRCSRINHFHNIFDLVMDMNNQGI
jgi:hypothetical protein